MNHKLAQDIPLTVKSDIGHKNGVGKNLCVWVGISINTWIPHGIRNIAYFLNNK